MQRATASGEMKHGPIALVDDKVPVIVIAPKDFLFEKNISKYGGNTCIEKNFNNENLFKRRKSDRN